MNSYKDQYQSYYAKVKENSPKVHYGRIGYDSNNYLSEGNSLYKNTSSSLYGVNKRGNQSNLSQKIVKRIITELVGTTILFLIVLICKISNVPEAMEVYNYGKEIINKEMSIEDIQLASIDFQELDIKDIQQNFENFMNDIKDSGKIQGNLSEETYRKYVTPIKGQVGEYDENGKSIFIEANEEELVVSSSDGVVKEVKESQDIGKYVLIDNKDGVEMIYGNLTDVNAQEGDKVRAGDRIGKTTIDKEKNKQGIYLKLLYMGNYKNPTEYINFNGNNIKE